jgi:hypothetical protein
MGNYKERYLYFQGAVRSYIAIILNTRHIYIRPVGKLWLLDVFRARKLVLVFMESAILFITVSKILIDLMYDYKIFCQANLI